MLQRGDMRIADGHGPLVEEEATEVGTAQTFEVSCKEGRIVEHVDPPESIVELQAVEHPGSVGQAVDVVGK